MSPLLNWYELTPKQREVAVSHRLNYLLQRTLEGSIDWDDSQPLFDAAFAKAQAMQTPWFAGEYVMEACGDLLRQVADSEAQQMLYFNPQFTETVSDCTLPNN